MYECAHTPMCLHVHTHIYTFIFLCIHMCIKICRHAHTCVCISPLESMRRRWGHHDPLTSECVPWDKGWFPVPTTQMSNSDSLMLIRSYYPLHSGYSHFTNSHNVSVAATCCKFRVESRVVRAGECRVPLSLLSTGAVLSLSLPFATFGECSPLFRRMSLS